jgi:hypothetical protein
MRSSPLRTVAARVGFAGPTHGGSFDDEDDVELAESAENAVGGLRLPGSDDSSPRPRAPGLLARLWGGGGQPPHADSAPAPAVPSAFDPTDPSGARARALLAFAQGVSPADAVDAFHASAPADAVDAARRVAAALAGGGGSGSAATLPRPGFAVTVTADEPALADLLYSSCMAGYLLKNAAARLELDRLLSGGGGGGGGSGGVSSAALLPGGSAATGPEPLPASSSPTLTPAAVAAALASSPPSASGFAPGVQTGGLAGRTVTKWNAAHGAVRLDAGAYIAALEAELETARLKLAGVGGGGGGWEAAGSGVGAAAWPLAAALGGPAAAASTSSSAAGNALLGFLRTADGPTLAGLTASASPGVLEAANTFCGRLVGSSSGGNGGQKGGSGGGGGRGTATTTTFAAHDLASLVLLSLIVGWGLRSLEARFDLDAAMA